MRLRRCQTVLIEPREHKEIDLELLLGATPRLASTLRWFALAPHLEQEQPLDGAEVALLGAVSPSDWSDAAELARTHAPATIENLLAKGLLVADDAGAHAAADRAARTRHWRPLAAVAHRHLRWRGVDTEIENARLGEISGGAVLDHLGPPPPPALDCAAPERRLGLPRGNASALDALLDRRVTCRNFDTARALSLAEVGAVLYRAFGARTATEVTGVAVLKKGVPSAGGLHPTEAYLLVQRVDGLAPGLYHYQPVAHALDPLREMSAEEAAEHARRFVAGQPWFARAPLQLIMASRFERNFWKYRNHAKAYRATILDAGHLSQTVYLAATELELAAFITAAVNEGDIEDALGLDPMEQGVLAVSGFGHRGALREEVEFDPLNAVWPA
ncbi:MAG: putative peptide maturation dehydrogenase [Rhodanobacteraceae bacterium]|jgi:putative peptide maturation dehydrogenase|nr:putative peptide maturation dehydrogenase [Rhodanobacteraceae bacterium]